LLLGYKPVRRVTVLNTAGSWNTSIIIYYNVILLYYKPTRPPLYMWFVDQNIVKQHVTVCVTMHLCLCCLCVCVCVEIYTLSFFLVGYFKHRNGLECGSVASMTVV